MCNLVVYVCLLVLGFSCLVQSLTDDEIAAFSSRSWIEGNTLTQGSVTITNKNNRLILKSNGVPDHATGIYQSNPNTLGVQNNRWIVKKNPQVAATSTCLPMGPIGMAMNGVAIYNPFSSTCCDAGESELNLFDTCWGHPSSNSMYHYHTAPLCLFKNICGVGSGIVGVAFDGFPIYGPIDEDGTQLKTENLDECHGKYASDGSYRYHITADFPYFLSCFRGTVISQNGVGKNCKCTEKITPCPEFGPSRKRRSASDALRLDENGFFTCCEEANNCETVCNTNTKRGDSGGYSP